MRSSAADRGAGPGVHDTGRPDAGFSVLPVAGAMVLLMLWLTLVLATAVVRPAA